MNFVVKKCHLFLILIIFLLLQEFAFGIGDFVIPYYFLAVIFFVIFCLTKYQNLILQNFKKLYKLRVGQYLLLFIIWILLGILISVFRGYFIPASFLSNFIGNFFCSNLLPFLIPALIIPFFISYKKLCKYLLMIYFYVFLLGIIEYLANTYNITFIQNIFITFVNRTEIKFGISRVFVEAFNSYRISGIFHEPGSFAAFMFISSPLIYFLCTTKTRLFKIRFADIFIKTSTLILLVICFIGTQSPINLVFMCIFVGITIVYKLFKVKIQYKTCIFSSIILVFFVGFLLLVNIMSFNDIDVTETYLSRILTVVDSIKSITELTLREPSLATRIGNYYAQFKIGLLHPILGVGYGNINSLWANIVKELEIPITKELAINAYIDGKQAGGASFLFKLIAETGFIGTLIFYMFLFSILIRFNKIKMLYLGYQRGLLDALSLSLILYICVSYYTFLQPIMWVYFGILGAMLLNVPKIKMINTKKDIIDGK